MREFFDSFRVKATLWILLIVASYLLLAPRRSQDVSYEPGTIEITYMSPDGPLQDAMEEVMREFENLSRQRHEATDGAYPIYKVVAGQNASADQVSDPTRFILSLVGGEPPDVIFFDRFAISEWAARGAFLELDSFIEKDQAAWDRYLSSQSANEGRVLPPWPGAEPEPPRAEGAPPIDGIRPIMASNFYPGAWAEARYRNPLDGSEGQYGIPCNADNRVLLYNKDILIRNGYVDENGEAQPPRSWEELQEMAKKMTVRDEQGRIKTVGFIPNYGNSWLYMYGWQAGGHFVSPDGLKATMNHPDIVYALDWMTRVYDSLGGAEAINAFQSTFQGDALDPFIQGKVGMKIDGVWVMTSLAQFGRDLNLGAAPPPLPQKEIDKGRMPLSWMGGWAYAIPSTSPRSEHAWELIRFLASNRAHKMMLRSERYTYLAQGRPYIPRQFPNREHNLWAYDEFVAGDPNLDPKFKTAMARFNEMLEVSRYRPITPVGQKLWNAQIAATEDAIYHKKTAQESLDYQNAIVQRDLDRVLEPVEGRQISSWNWFYWLYAFVVVAIIWMVVQWDTKPQIRQRLKQSPVFKWLSFFGDKDQPAISLEGKKGSYFRSEWKGGLICASPWIIGFLVFAGGPLLFSIIISFCSFDILNEATFTGAHNYIYMVLEDELFWKSFGNTLYMVMGVPLGLVLGLGIALLLTTEVKGVAVWRTCFYLPSIVPMVASSILWIWIFNPDSGMLNQLLQLIGIANGPNWLQSEETSKISLILMGLWGAGGGMIIWIAGIKGISTSYYEAASIDGANTWQQFIHITIPQLTPYIFFNLIMGLIGTFQIFAQAFIMTNGGPANSTLFYVYHLFNSAFRYLQMGYASSMAWFLFVIVLILTMVQMHYSKKWVHYEGD